jgi:hypothetical protein
MRVGTGTFNLALVAKDWPKKDRSELRHRLERERSQLKTEKAALRRARLDVFTVMKKLS